MSPCKVSAAADAVLGQCHDFIRSVPTDRYTQPCDAVGGGTVGKHARHVLDHFCSAIRTEACDPIDYDHRERGGDVETNPEAACEQIGRLREELASLGEDRMDEPVTARVMLAGDGVCADLKSSRGRELFFAMHHAIHHYAMMKTIGQEMGVECPCGFGMAPSTLNFESAR